MALPVKLQELIENEAKKYPAERLLAASEELTSRYRERDIGSQNFMASDIHRVAYLVARMPATYAVVKRVLSEIPMRIPEANCNSLLDLGSGPGTVLWAASETLPQLNQITCVEQDAPLVNLAKKLSSQPNFSSVKWEVANINNYEIEPHDVIVLSYAIGELSNEARQKLLQKTWRAARECVVLIEPGTMAGFAGIRSSRAELIEQGAFIAAPCPHRKPCPMPENDWCHFAERLERTSLHRKMKSGTLSYEDEKYSYVIASKIQAYPVRNRILRHPGKHGGHINFELCTLEGLQKVTISKRDKEAYKEARKLDWGDELVFGA